MTHGGGCGLHRCATCAYVTNDCMHMSRLVCRLLTLEYWERGTHEYPKTIMTFGFPSGIIR